MPSPIDADNLWEAWERVQENDGCAGADGVTVAHFGARAQRAIPALIERVDSGIYRAFPLLKIVVEKHSGHAGTRTLLVPTVADRVLQTAAARYLSRSFEEEFLECSYGYRPGRSVDRAIARIRKCRDLGYRFVADADIQTFFDNVDHSMLLGRLGQRITEPLLRVLLRQWIDGCVWDGKGITRLRKGVPQGSPISPLLANFFLEDFDRELEKSGRKLIRYADDFLILARTQEDATQALAESERLLADDHLLLNPEKTRIVDFAHGFRFLGALFQDNAIWTPWKNDRVKGRILFMAPPLPVGMRVKFEMAPPRSAMELALDRTGAALRAFTDHTQRPETSERRTTPVAFLYLTEQGTILRKAGDRFLVEKEDEVLLDLPYHKLENVLLFGNIQVTTQALAELLEKGVNLSLFSRQGQYRGSLTPPRGKNIELRLAQFDCYRDAARALGMARGIVGAKISNGLVVLARYRSRNDVAAPFEERRMQMETAAASLGSANAVAELDGFEGMAARAYFEALMQFNKSGMAWPGRQKHPATDPLNALLSLGYTLLMHELTALLEGAGLDPYLGFLHQLDYGRPSLALDLVEAFRHPVVDRLTLTLVNREMLGTEDFRSGGERPGVFLKPEAMRRYFGEYERWMLERPIVKEPAAGSAPRQCFRDLLKDEVEKLASALRDARPFEPFRSDAEEAECNTSSVTI